MKGGREAGRQGAWGDDADMCSDAKCLCEESGEDSRQDPLPISDSSHKHFASSMPHINM